MPDRPFLRLGLIGCGRLAEVGYAPAARAAAGVAIVAVSDPDRRRRQLVAAKLGGVSAHARVSELLAAGPLDGMIVCSAPEHHEENAAQAAAAGLTALVEKPPAPDAEGALRIAALQPTPWIGFNRRFDQGLRLAKRIPATGELQLKMVLHYRRKSWKPVAGGDDVLLDLGPHVIDLALFLTGALPLAVRATAGRERVGVVMATSRGQATIECATDRPHRELIEVRNVAGRRVWRASRGGTVRNVAGRLLPGPHPLVRSLTHQLEAFGGALRGEDPGPLATAGEGAATMCVLDAARRSDAIGGEQVPVQGVTVQDAGPP